MSKTAFVFSGQGSQYVGMGTELADLNVNAKRVFECCSDILGYDMLKKIRTSSKDELKPTVISQPAIMAVSLAAAAVIESRNISADAVAGHSLGEYAALVVSGVLTMEQGFEVIKLRAEAMQRCAQTERGAMCAVMGIKTDRLKDILNDIDGYAEPVNYNCPGQIVIAGEENALKDAMEKLSATAKRCVRLNVNAAFHSKMMNKAAEEFQNGLKTFDFKDPQIDFYSNVTADKIEKGAKIKELMVKHLISPVQFCDEIKNMANNGINAFVELGPKKVLSKFIKKSVDEAKTFNVEDEATLNNAVQILSAFALQ